MYAYVIFYRNSLIPSFKRDSVIIRMTYWLALWIVGNQVRISSLPLLLQAQIISLNFLKGVFITFPLALLISLKLKIYIPKYLLGSYYTNLKTPLIIRPSISYYQDFSNGPPRAVITPSFRSFRDSSILAYSLQVIKVIKILSSFIAVIN